jgi:glucosamine 6-phosphate synthetase-like amidotransferase/phosphosugar isomerase protein
MCAIYGCYLLTNADRKRVREVMVALGVKSLAYGIDAGGLMWGTPRGVKSIKWRGAASSREYAQRLQRILDDGATWVGGHCRLATWGTPDRASNNHPVTGRRFLVMHNGTIENHEEVCKKHGKDAAQVDTASIVHVMEARGGDMVNAVRNTATLRGSAAVIIADRQSPHAVLLARFATSPLALALVEDIGAIVWASHKHTIEDALTIREVKHGAFSVTKEKLPAVFRELREGEGYLLRPAR